MPALLPVLRLTTDSLTCFSLITPPDDNHTLRYVAAVSADGLTLTLADDARTSVTGEWGGWDGAAVMILNGTGTGTWRRVTHAGWGNPLNP